MLKIFVDWKQKHTSAIVFWISFFKEFAVQYMWHVNLFLWVSTITAIANLYRFYVLLIKKKKIA